MSDLRSMVPLTVVALAFGASPALAQREAWTTDFSRHTVPLEEIVSGGPPKDGIPALDRPRFTSVSEADTWLSDRDPVVLFEEGNEAKAYPLQILIWHEIVNDVVGGRPVAITFCPLCNTALAFDRRLDGQTLDFGTTGRLRHSDLVMYDRQTESWWQQATGEGIVGVHAGRQLEFVSAPLVSWETFKEAHPAGLVLSRRTGYDRPYGENPYTRYDDAGGSPIGAFFRGGRDDRLPAMARVVAFGGAEACLRQSESHGDLCAYYLTGRGAGCSVESRRDVEGHQGGPAFVRPPYEVPRRTFRCTPQAVADQGVYYEIDGLALWG